MTRHEATFTIDEPSDAYAAQRILDQLYDVVREETSSAREETDGMVAFEALQEAAKPPAPGSLTVTYEREDGGFED